MHDWVVANERMAQALAGEGLRLPVRLRAQRRALRPRREAADAAGRARVAVATPEGRVTPSASRPGRCRPPRVSRTRGVAPSSAPSCGTMASPWRCRMGLMDFIRGQLIEIIEWTDDSRDTLSYRFPDEDKEIKRGAQLIVRESQVVQFVYLGQFGDQFGPGKHTLDHRQHPDPDAPQGLEVRLRVAVQGRRLLRHHAPVHRQQVGHLEPGDDARPGLRHRARCAPSAPTTSASSTPPRFLKEVAGTDHHFRLDEFADVDALAHRQRLQRGAGHGQGAGARRGHALQRARRGAAAADQPGARREVRPRDDELHRRERLGAARGRSRRSTSARAWPRSAT